MKKVIITICFWLGHGWSNGKNVTDSLHNKIQFHKSSGDSLLLLNLSELKALNSVVDLSAYNNTSLLKRVLDEAIKATLGIKRDQIRMVDLLVRAYQKGKILNRDMTVIQTTPIYSSFTDEDASVTVKTIIKIEMMVHDSKRFGPVNVYSSELSDIYKGAKYVMTSGGDVVIADETEMKLHYIYPNWKSRPRKHPSTEVPIVLTGYRGDLVWAVTVEQDIIATTFENVGTIMDPFIEARQSSQHSQKTYYSVPDKSIPVAYAEIER